MELTPEVLGNSFMLTFIVFLISFGFQIYMMYLNIKQSKVNNQMADLITEVREIKEMISKKKNIK